MHLAAFRKVHPRDDQSQRLRKSCSTDGRFRNKCNAYSSQDCEDHLLNENLTDVLRATKQLTAHELHGVQRISRFVVCIGLYLFNGGSPAESPINDVKLTSAP